MIDNFDPYLASRKLLNRSYAQIWAIAKSKGIDTTLLDKSLREAYSEFERYLEANPEKYDFEYKENYTYLHLHSIGFSTVDLAGLMGVTKQAISFRIQTISDKPLTRVEDNYQDLPPISEIKLKFWEELTKHPEKYYGGRGKVNKRLAQKYIVSFGYKWKQAEMLRSQLSGYKTEIVLTVCYDLPTTEEHKSYLRERLKKYTLLEIHNELVSKSKLKWHLMTTHRYVTKQLGLTVPIHPKRGIK